MCRIFENSYSQYYFEIFSSCDDSFQTVPYPNSAIICDALHDLVPFVQFKKREKLLHGCFSRLHAHSKQLLTGHCTTHAQRRQILFWWKSWRAPGVEIRTAFLICYLQSLYEIEPGHYFCPEFVGYVTNQNILVDAGKLM